MVKGYDRLWGKGGLLGDGIHVGARLYAVMV